MPAKKDNPMLVGLVCVLLGAMLGVGLGLVKDTPSRQEMIDADCKLQECLTERINNIDQNIMLITHDVADIREKIGAIRNEPAK